jgi:hypothetical protein
MGYALVFPSVDGVKRAQSAVNQLIYANIMHRNKKINHKYSMAVVLFLHDCVNPVDKINQAVYNLL